MSIERYVFKKKVVNLKLSKNIIKKVPLVIVYDNRDKIYIVHPISQFIFDNYFNSKFNSQRMAIDKVIPFLNYVVSKGVKLSELRFVHGERFLNSLSLNGLAKNTVKKYEQVLTKFYYWLSKNKIIKIQISKFIINEKEKYVQSPFKKIIYNPSLPTNNIIHTIKLELVPMFLDTAIKETNIIALGVYFQLFGGLRKGAIVNLKKSSVNLMGVNGEYGIELNIKKNYFRNDIADSSGSTEVKKQRKQIVLSVGNNILTYLYQNHINKYTNNKTDALFSNNNGKAMTGASYEYYFKKLRQAFIRRLLDSDDIRLNGYGKVLSTQKWSTHIGRGIFSNMVAEYSNELQLSIIRGDSNVNSSRIYVEKSEKAINKISDALNKMYFDVIKDLKE
ncbi:TPA: hypothetical protein ACXDAY_002487 [Clostridium botulinum]|uniref:hypothetical protein n=1 Tax=Clostridium botulinum TaxID=1491 RepID=UPI00035BA19F|nr:hypothetical protein [Clostridium botulinum]APQ73287.1 hypothetical protein RSJ9_2305 [Clostridium botulinum]APQ98456.1 hypothetical protein RSJ3_2017 [Clostridium botulinum]EPS56242.1 hypothetical protein CLQ_12123 [Clostridium botulinum Af84]MBN3350517.1 hypothetical protein [Clostridium botulinum]MBN3357553.1 hypothetical protein [Clostridium botulinum]